MARFILIDNHSGYVFGDTDDFNGSKYTATSPCDAARELDETIVGERGRSYIEHKRQPYSLETGYRVYRTADVNQVPVIFDGQDQEAIDAVERDCEFVGFVEVRRAAE